jgi:thiamine biosynthesis lipoprotein
MLTFKTLKLIVLIALASGLGLTACDRGSSVSKAGGTDMIMGTFVSIKLMDGEAGEEELRRHIREAFALGRKISGRMSVFDQGSELNRVNRSGGGSVSPELYEVISLAVRISDMTNGEFDITVAPVMERDGLYAGMPEELRSLISGHERAVGYGNILLDEKRRRISLRNGAWMDLSGIAKGYIVDRLYGALDEAGIDGIMVNAGGDIYCGEKTGAGAWRVGVREPGASSVLIAMDLRDKAVATSGDYENVIRDELSGEYISHIVDPSSGTMAGNTPSSVTVVASSCAVADALATGMMAMGPQKALSLAGTLPEVDIVYIFRDDGREQVMMTREMKEHIVWEDRRVAADRRKGTL